MGSSISIEHCSNAKIMPIGGTSRTYTKRQTTQIESACTRNYEHLHERFIKLEQKFPNARYRLESLRKHESRIRTLMSDINNRILRSNTEVLAGHASFRHTLTLLRRCKEHLAKVIFTSGRYIYTKQTFDERHRFGEVMNLCREAHNPYLAQDFQMQKFVLRAELNERTNKVSRLKHLRAVAISFLTPKNGKKQKPVGLLLEVKQWSDYIAVKLAEYAISKNKFGEAFDLYRECEYLRVENNYRRKEFKCHSFEPELEAIYKKAIPHFAAQEGPVSESQVQLLIQIESIFFESCAKRSKPGLTYIAPEIMAELSIQLAEHGKFLEALKYINDEKYVAVQGRVAIIFLQSFFKSTTSDSLEPRVIEWSAENIEALKQKLNTNLPWVRVAIQKCADVGYAKITSIPHKSSRNFYSESLVIFGCRLIKLIEGVLPDESREIREIVGLMRNYILDLGKDRYIAGSFTDREIFEKMLKGYFTRH